MFKADHIAQKRPELVPHVVVDIFVEIRQLDRMKMYFDVKGDDLLYLRFSDTARKNLNFST